MYLKTNIALTSTLILRFTVKFLRLFIYFSTWSGFLQTNFSFIFLGFERQPELNTINKAFYVQTFVLRRLVIFPPQSVTFPTAYEKLLLFGFEQISFG